MNNPRGLLAQPSRDPRSGVFSCSSVPHPGRHLAWTAAVGSCLVLASALSLLPSLSPQESGDPVRLREGPPLLCSTPQGSCLRRAQSMLKVAPGPASPPPRALPPHSLPAPSPPSFLGQEPRACSSSKPGPGPSLCLEPLPESPCSFLPLLQVFAPVPPALTFPDTHQQRTSTPSPLSPRRLLLTLTICVHTAAQC